MGNRPGGCPARSGRARLLRLPRARRHGFGSDLDLVAVVSESELPRLERNRDWPCERLPVPTDLLVYTIEEWERMRRKGGRFARMIDGEAVWVLGEAP